MDVSNIKRDIGDMNVNKCRTITSSINQCKVCMECICFHKMWHPTSLSVLSSKHLCSSQNLLYLTLDLGLKAFCFYFSISSRRISCFFSIYTFFYKITETNPSFGKFFNQRICKKKNKY